MKFKDVRSIQSLLNEYGLKPGSATPVGSQQSGTSAKANAVSSPTIQKQTPKKDLGSPTTTPGLDVKEPEQPTQVAKKVKDLEQGAFFKNEKNEVAGEIVSKLGDKPQPDKVVVKDIRGEYKVVDPDDQVMVDVDVEEGKLSKLSKSSGSSLKLAKVNKLKNKLKRLSRKFRLREQGSELIFEINFNSKEIAQQALDLPIKCGFEAETSWDNVYSGGDDDGDWMEGENWSVISDAIYDQEGSRAINRIEEDWREWLMDTDYFYEAERQLIDELVNDREEDEYYLNKYIEDELSEDDIEEYKERILDDLPKEDQEEYEDWDFMNWSRQYVEEELLDEYKDWLREDIRENGEAFDSAFESAMDEAPVETYMEEVYGSWFDLLSDYEVYLGDPNRSGEGGQEEVAEYLTDWTDKNSQYQEVKAGEYHSRAGDTTQDYWRVEEDSSIQTDGTGSEIISPVYSTPRKMLEEMKSLFAWLEYQDVDTNSSTGLHVTMSLDSEDAEEINPVKLAVLLGDKYLLSTFGRKNNSYAKSQYKNLEKLGHKLKANPDAKTIEQIEDILSSGIAKDKFSSINFKGDSDIRTGNQLIEFRIGGGNDYHRDFPKVAKAVIRYATTMQSAYSDKLYTRDYATALYRLINNIGKISADDEERVKDRINPDIEAPAVDVLKDYFSKDNYVEHLRYLVAAYNTLAEYYTVKNKTNEDVETDGPDADRLQDLLKKAQENFAGAIAQAGYDFSQGHNRATPNAKSIGILRSALKDFELDYDKLNSLINGHHTKIDTGDRRSNLTPKQILGRIKNGVDKLFKKSVVQEPEYLSANQVEKLINGMWNAVNSGEIKDSKQAIQFAKLLAGASGKSEDAAAAWVDEIRSQSANREYKEFHKSVTQGSYGEKAIFTPGSPVDAKKLKAFTDHLKQYPEWEHPVSRNHNPNTSFDDSYIDNALSKMMIKMRARWEHLEAIRQDKPGLYIDSMREIAKLVTNLVSAVKTVDHMMGDKHKDLLGTDHTNYRDGPQYFGLGERSAEQIMDMVKGIEQPGERMVWDEPVTYKLRDSIQNYIRTAYTRYYEMKSRQGDGFYRIGSVPEIIKQRTDAIKKFLTGFDSVAQKLGFDSQSSEIANKKQLDKKQAKFQSKHGPRTFKVDAFDFGGYVFAEKGFAQGVEHMAPEGVARALQQTSNIHRTDFGELLIMPTIHYFTALEAWKMLSNPAQFKDTWRWEKAQAVLKKFESVYKIKFNDLSEKYIDINDDNQRVKTKLKQQNVVFTDKLGDGREGVGKFGPLIPRADLNGPDGEPFEPSSAVTWRINRDEEKAGIPSHLQGLNDFGKARVNFREFDYMMNNGIQQYVKDSEKQDLVAFLNNETQVDTATKVRMLKLMINNVDHDLREPMPISQALVRAKPQSESMNTFDKFDNLPLAEQLRIIAKVDKKKIDEAWSKKYKDSINCSNPKGFSQKAHCDGKKKKMSERPLTKDEKSDKEKYVKGMKKSKGDFEKRYGKDAKSVMYATATKMAKEGVAEGFKESLPDNDRITTLNKLLADVFPVSDLKKQMLAFQAIPVPQMLNDFRRLRSEAGDDACARSIVRAYINALPKEVQQKINLNEWSKQHISNLLTEAKGIMGRVAGDQFKRNEDTLEFNGVTTYPQDREQFDDPAERDSFVADIEQQLNTQIEWTNVPNNGALAFAIAKLTDPSLDDKPTYWGRYFKKAGVDMMGRWSNSQIPAGWKLQKAGALKMDIAIDPQHLIQNENIYNGIDEVISTVAKNSQGHEIQQELLNGLTSIKNQQHPVFEGQIKNLPAIRDYFGEIMGPVALMAGMVGGQAEDARRDLMNGAEWSSYGVKWPQEMNFALVDSIFIGPDGTEVGISSKGGKGARASSKNIADAIAKASDEMKQTHQFAVKVLTIIQENSAAQGPFRLAEFLGVLPNGLEKEILGYATQGKTDYNGISKSAKELFNYGTPRQDVPGFNTGYALIALLAKKVAKLINENPEFGAGCLAFLNQSSIVQLYCKMGKQGEDARVTGWEAVYPPNFQGTVVLDGSKNYYSSRLGGKFSFGFV